MDTAYVAGTPTAAAAAAAEDDAGSAVAAVELAAEPVVVAAAGPVGPAVAAVEFAVAVVAGSAAAVAAAATQSGWSGRTEICLQTIHDHSTGCRKPTRCRTTTICCWPVRMELEEKPTSS